MPHVGPMAEDLTFHPPMPPSPDSRRGALAKALEAGPSTTHFVPFHKGYIEAPVVEVADEQLVYRAANGRLVSELTARGLTAEQRDDAEEQRTLHALLIDKARDPAGPIYEELALHARQTEPLLVTRAGLVVNGNRRLAAMRELRAREPEKYARFATVSVALLPDGMSEDEIEYVEAALQMAPDLKLDYSWINRRLKLRDHVERLALPQDDIMAAYRFASPEAVDRELGELAMAERYLRYRGMPGRYDDVIDLEEPITGMMGELDRISNKALAELWSFAGFAMIAERERLETRIDRHFPFHRPQPFELVHWVMRSYGEEQGLFEPQATGENKPVRPRDAERLLPLLRDPERSDEVATRIVALTDRLRANQEQEIGGAQIIHHLRKAREGLQQTEVETIALAQAREIRAEILALSDYLDSVAPTSAEGETEAGSGTVFSKLFGR